MERQEYLAFFLNGYLIRAPLEEGCLDISGKVSRISRYRVNRLDAEFFETAV
jgi:hypothetical protein